MQARVNQVTDDLPAGLDIQVERQTPSLFPIISYNLEGGDPATLYDIARYQIKPLISRVPGVGRVDVQGSDVREIEVVADPARLAGQRLTFEDVANAIRQATTVTAVGRMPENYKQYLIVSAGEAHSTRRRRERRRAATACACATSRRSRRARKTTSASSPATASRRRCSTSRASPAAIPSRSRTALRAIARTLRTTLPPGARLKPVYDQAALVRDAVESVRDAMLIGAVLAVIVLLLFLRHARITAISASSIPLTMAITVFVMSLLGQTFNLMTLGAMAIAIGLVIDDAVVITENIVRHLHLTADRDVAIREAVQEIIWPVTTSTITTVVVFLPLGLLTGVEGSSSMRCRSR